MSMNSSTRPKRLHLGHRLLKGILSVTPARWKLALYRFIYDLYLKFASDTRSRVVEMPYFGLALKRRSEDGKHNETDALRFVNTRLAGLVEAPLWIDSVFLLGVDQYTWNLMTHIQGDLVCDVWDQLTEEDKEKLVQQLKIQVDPDAMHAATTSLSRPISDVEGRPILDVRIPWMGQDEEAVVFESTKAFARKVWPTTPLETDLADFVRPFIEREGVPIVFSHGDLLPKNLILPGGLSSWRKEGRVCIVDWDTACWAPLYWDALKATWLLAAPDAPWILFMRRVFPGCKDALDNDWEWRSRTRITIL
ncbi:hypothetical protein SCHPADRAFT_452890 [Schizopora paradoxa]|uniref:Aminoglycoside phosphotransferase domain-containing protein n=1 Tax=Schizopora paradoxa TaxID=27342 RepID=A0A0H2RQM7_9AGAM|nr:hypothetical protein SCHPADRAFT_452890 [Schizopora paradoxa]